MPHEQGRCYSCNSICRVQCVNCGQSCCKNHRSEEKVLCEECCERDADHLDRLEAAALEREAREDSFD